MTKEGITLASDMAMTTPENKSYNYGNKIFKLTNDFPIGIMMNGNVDFEDIPLETLIGEFAKTIDFKKIKTVEHIKYAFIEYLSANTNHTSCDEYLKEILSNFRNELVEEINEYGFDETLNYYERKELHSLVKNYENFSNEFFDIIPNDKNNERYNFELWKIFSYYLSFEGTGIIFAGFDIDNFYPTFFEINLYFNDNGNIIYDEIDSGVNCRKPVIKVFAINEEAYTFITGVSRDFEEYILEYVNESHIIFLEELKEKLIKEKGYTKEQIKNLIDICKLIIEDTYSDFNETIKKFKHDSIKDTSESAEFLPKFIHWNLADYLIKLTALKQKFSSENETVSSETEIAFITKQNYFEWVQKENIIFR